MLCYTLKWTHLSYCLQTHKKALKITWKSIYLFFFNVLCFSANSTIFSLTWRPLRRRTAFMCFLATFSLSAFSPKCKYSSSVVGTQNGSISITCNEQLIQTNQCNGCIWYKAARIWKYFEGYIPHHYSHIVIINSLSPASSYSIITIGNTCITQR